MNAHLVDPKKIFFPRLHIKLGLLKNFVKAVDRNGRGFMYLKEKFPRLSDAKMKEGIFIGPHIRELIKDENFEGQLNNLGKHGCQKCMDFFQECIDTIFRQQQI